MATSGGNGKNTPMLDELEKGPWPSFVTQIKETATTKEQARQLLQLLERSYHEKVATGSTAASWGCSATAAV